MIRQIEEQREVIESLCRRFHVHRLELFGSAAVGGFNPRTCDVDFLVAFDVDLVVAGSVKNPYLLESIQRSRTLLCAALA